MSTNGKHGAMHPVDRYLAHLANIGRPDTTIRTYRCALRCAAAEMPAGLLSVHDEIEAWLATRAAPSTRVVYRAALRGFYSWAVRRGVITENPTTELEPVKRKKGVPRPASLEEVAHILTNARQPVRTWAAAAAYEGARCIEVSRLDRADITEQTTRLHGKGDRERLVPTHPQFWVMVRDLSGPIAGDRSAPRVSTLAAEEFDRIGLPEITMHRLRHTAGTMWQAATGDIRVTQELLGHASVATTQVYTAVSDQAMRAAVLAMPPLTVSAATAAGAAPAEPSAPGSPR